MQLQNWQNLLEKLLMTLKSQITFIDINYKKHEVTGILRYIGLRYVTWGPTIPAQTNEKQDVTCPAVKGTEPCGWHR